MAFSGRRQTDRGTDSYIKLLCCIKHCGGLTLAERQETMKASLSLPAQLGRREKTEQKT